MITDAFKTLRELVQNRDWLDAISVYENTILVHYFGQDGGLEAKLFHTELEFLEWMDIKGGVK